MNDASPLSPPSMPPIVQYVHWDEPVLEIGPGRPITWHDLKALAEYDGVLVWDMMGERRLLPHAILANLHQIRVAHEALRGLGRGAEVSLKGLCFTRAQTIPLREQELDDRSQVLCEQTPNAANDSSPA